MIYKSAARAALLVAGLFCASYAHAANIPPRIDQPWARATAPGAMAGGVFLMLHGGDDDDILLGAASPVAQVVEVHRTVNESGIMRMLPMDALAVPAHQMIAFKPGGYHIMLMGLKQPLTQGESFPLTLTFQHAAPVTVQVKVAGPGATAAGDGMDDAGHHGMDMGGKQ